MTTNSPKGKTGPKPSGIRRYGIGLSPKGSEKLEALHAYWRESDPRMTYGEAVERAVINEAVRLKV